MCVIAICQTHRPTLEVLKECERANPHKAGIAWRDHPGENWRWRKGLEAGELVALTDNVPLPFVIHFRIASIGGRDVRLCHPFPAGGGLELWGQAERLLFQNGHFPYWKALTESAGCCMPNGLMSDTRAMSVLMDRIGDGIQKVLPELPDKWVLCNKENIYYYGEFETLPRTEDILWSNLNWEYWLPRYRGRTEFGTAGMDLSYCG